MIAIVILGIGLLVTSSMFPIAWFKAREVAEATTIPAISDQAETAVKMLCQVNGPPGSSTERASSFFPGEFFFDRVQGDSNLDGVVAAPYPDTRVHVLNLGNYGVGFVAAEPNPFDPSSATLVPVADNPWTLEDTLNPWLTGSLYVPQFEANGYHLARAQPHIRLFPPANMRPDPSLPTVDPAEVALWDEQFETRRYCWAVLYRFGAMPGPDGNFDSTIGKCLKGKNLSTCNDAKTATVEGLRGAPILTCYYVTLKRPGGAKYARQEGYVFSGGNGSWNPSKLLDHPRAQVGTVVPQLLLPTPWRIKAELLNPPVHPSVDYPVPPTGIPSEIKVDDLVLADMLAEGTTLIDDRTGQIFRVTQRRKTISASSFILTLDKEYTQADIHTSDYIEFPSDGGDPAEFGESWKKYWDWRAKGCEQDPEQPACEPSSAGGEGEDQPEQRFYWVFPPPVESVDGNGVPVFDGSPPVVGIEVRQLILRPKG